MIARDDGGIGGAHYQYAVVGGCGAVVSQPMAPLPSPLIVGCRISEKIAGAGVAVEAGNSLAETPEGQGEVSLVLRHTLQKLLRKRQVTGLRVQQAKLASKALGVGRLKDGAETIECFIRL